MHFPITVATVPFRIPNSVHQPQIKYGLYFKNYSIDLNSIFIILLQMSQRSMSKGVVTLGQNFYLAKSTTDLI